MYPCAPAPRPHDTCPRNLPMTLSSHRVQGLSNDEVAADWPAISADELARLRGDFPQLEGPCELVWHSPRPLSAAAIVQTPTQRLFLKRHPRHVRSAATLREEHCFIAHLASAGLPVVAVQPTRHGDTALDAGDGCYELHSLGQGDDLYRDAPSWTPPSTPQHAFALGAMLARLHQAAAGYRAPQRATHLLVARDDLIRAHDPLAVLAQQLPQRPGLADYLARRPWQDDLQRSLLPWHARLGTRLDAEPVLWTHNDLHVSNLLWQPDQRTISTVLDFGLASPTSALFDLATAIERNAVAWLALDRGEPAARPDMALAVLAGYRSVRALSAAQLQLLADLLPIVHFDFALSEVEYFHAITGSEANADVAYHTFLLGHADWFLRTEGAALLDLLRAAG